jgi:hypothetical protein
MFTPSEDFCTRDKSILSTDRVQGAALSTDGVIPRMWCNSWPFTERLEYLNRLKKFRDLGSHGSLCISVPLMLCTTIPQCLIECTVSFRDVNMCFIRKHLSLLIYKNNYHGIETNKGDCGDNWESLNQRYSTEIIQVALTVEALMSVHSSVLSLTGTQFQRCLYTEYICVSYATKVVTLDGSMTS